MRLSWFFFLSIDECTSACCFRCDYLIISVFCWICCCWMVIVILLQMKFLPLGWLSLALFRHFSAFLSFFFLNKHSNKHIKLSKPKRNKLKQNRKNQPFTWKESNQIKVSVHKNHSAVALNQFYRSYTFRHQT